MRSHRKSCTTFFDIRELQQSKMGQNGLETVEDRFEPFGARLDLATMTYYRDGSIDVEAWSKTIAGRREKKNEARVTVDIIVDIVRRGKIKKAALVKEITKTGVSGSHAYEMIKKAVDIEAIKIRKDGFFYVSTT
jgi:hypothetical protein